MLIDFNQVLHDKAGDGEALSAPRRNGDGEEDLTLGKVCCRALTMGFPDERADGEELVGRYFLAQRIKTGTEPLETTAEEAADMKKLIKKAFPSPVIVGECWPLLDGKKDPVFYHEEKD